MIETLSIGLPTGDKKYGFGEGQTKLAALLFIDQAWRNWYFGANAEFESVVAGPTETEKKNDSLAILPGMHLWHPNSDWLVTAGIELPLSSFRNHDFTMHLKLKNHFNWGSFFK